ncbi:MAG: pitrilysin family protein [Rhodocyclaceae bacterium]
MRKWIGFAIGLACLAAAAAVQAGVRIEHWTAASGARVYFVESHGLPILDLSVGFPAGSAYDPPERMGLAGLTRGLMEAGAGGIDEETLAARLVDAGARLSGSTEADRAGFSLRTLSGAREREAALAVLAAILQKPEFPAAALERERARVIAGIREGDTRPDVIGSKRFNREIFPNHPYGWSATAESVAAISREDLVRFHRSRYAAASAVVAIVGDVSRTEAEAIAERLTAGLPAQASAESLPAQAPPARHLVRIDHPASQSHVLIGLPGMSRDDPDYFPLLVGNHILGGGGFVSWLMQEVREKRGFAYSVYSYFQPMRQPGPFQIGLQTKREQVGEAVEVVEATLRRFLAEGPSERDLRRAKQNLADGFVLRLDSNRKILEYVAMIGFYRLPLDYLDQYPKRVRAVTRAQIRDAFARRVKPENLVTVIVAGGS